MKTLAFLLCTLLALAPGCVTNPDGTQTVDVVALNQVSQTALSLYAEYQAIQAAGREDPETREDLDQTVTEFEYYIEILDRLGRLDVLRKENPAVAKAVEMVTEYRKDNPAKENK